VVRERTEGLRVDEVKTLAVDCSGAIADVLRVQLVLGGVR
jgi:hypothetical protein